MSDAEVPAADETCAFRFAMSWAVVTASPDGEPAFPIAVIRSAWASALTS
jgi:hypothetical protein